MLLGLDVHIIPCCASSWNHLLCAKKQHCKHCKHIKLQSRVYCWNSTSTSFHSIVESFSVSQDPHCNTTYIVVMWSFWLLVRYVFGNITTLEYSLKWLWNFQFIIWRSFINFFVVVKSKNNIQKLKFNDFYCHRNVGLKGLSIRFLSHFVLLLKLEDNVQCSMLTILILYIYTKGVNYCCEPEWETTFEVNFLKPCDYFSLLF